MRGLLTLLGANLMERSLFTMVTIYLPAFLMLSYHMTAFGVAPVLAVVAVGTIAGNMLGGWLGDRFLKPGIFVVAQLVAGTLGLLLFGAALVLPVVVALVIVIMAPGIGRPSYSRWPCWAAWRCMNWLRVRRRAMPRNSASAPGCSSRPRWPARSSETTRPSRNC